jgi:hypothetical protein
VELVDSVSGLASGLAARGDESRVRQILVNLLSNAVKFTSPGGQITLSAGAAERPSPNASLAGDGPWVYIRVEDTGVGIPADRLEAVFEPFVQGDMTLTREHGGTGLGLAISRRLARLMGGDLTAQSDVGVGSTFFLWLAAAPEQFMRTGAVQGHGPTGETPLPAEGGEEATAIGALRAVSDALRLQVERILHAYVARIRTDPQIPSARGLDEKQLEDHLATFLADVTQTLGTIDAVAGEPNASLRDGTAIQRIVASRHGAQRARLGWAEHEVRREFVILGEELAAAVHRRIPQASSGGAVLEAERTILVLEKFLQYAQQASIETFRATRAARPSDR